jgi:hypothetical protein
MKLMCIALSSAHTASAGLQDGRVDAFYHLDTLKVIKHDKALKHVIRERSSLL